MARTVSFLCLSRINSNLCTSGRIFFPFSPSKHHVKYLRGSRYRRETSNEEAKYRQLLKALKESGQKSESINLENTTHLAKNLSTQEAESFKNSGSDLTIQQLCQKFQEKITPLKDMKYSRQLERKYYRAMNLLRIFGQKLEALKVPISLGSEKLPCPIELTVPSPVIEAYRNQDEFSIGTGLDGNSKTVGFFIGRTSIDSHMVCMVPEEITIIKESHKKFVKDFQNYIRQSSLDAFMSLEGEGHWRSVTLRSNAAGELMAILTIHPQTLSQEELKKEKENLKIHFGADEKLYNLKSLYFHECSQPRCNDDHAKMELLLGEACIVEDFQKLKLQLSPQSYLHSNPHALEAAYKLLLRQCKVTKATTLIDINCGIGPLSLMFSPYVKRCIGVDSCAHSIKDAQQNAVINNCNNLEFIRGNPDLLLHEILNQDYHEDIVTVINPSRSELSKVAVRSMRACRHLKKIVYISPHPKAALENFTKLCRLKGSENYLGKSFVPILGVPVDFYPQTEHYGLMVVFQRL